MECFRISDDQEAVVAFLKDPASYGAGVHQVDVIETHISLVFLAGDRAYKLKRAVKYPYLDFSTEAKHRQACEAEVSLNRPTAQDLYLEVRAVSRSEDGRVANADSFAIGIKPETAVSDAANRFDRRLLDNDKAGARYRQRTQVLEMPVVCRAVLGAVLAHR
jgi:aminoglycoside phosphotransferase family enzyme